VWRAATTHPPTMHASANLGIVLCYQFLQLLVWHVHNIILCR
jgi:hypothetical protein